MDNYQYKSKTLSYFASIILGLRRNLGFDAWRTLPANFHKALAKKNLQFCIKAGLAAVLSDLMAGWAGLNHGLWAPMSALIVMQVQMTASLEASLMRLLGTIAGGCIGVIAFWLMLTTGMGILPALFFVGVVGAFLEVWDLRFRMAGITAVLVLLMGGTVFSTAYSFAYTRVIEMAMGIISALLVSTVLWPASISYELHKTLDTQFSQIGDMIQQLTNDFVSGARTVTQKTLDTLFDAISNNAVEYKRVQDYEMYYARRNYPDLEEYIDSIYTMRSYLAGMYDALDAQDTTPQQWDFIQNLQATAQMVSEALHNLSKKDADTQAQLEDFVTILCEQMQTLRRNGYFRQCSHTQIMQMFSFYNSISHIAKTVIALQKKITMQDKT